MTLTIGDLEEVCDVLTSLGDLKENSGIVVGLARVELSSGRNVVIEHDSREHILSEVDE